LTHGSSKSQLLNPEIKKVMEGETTVS